MTLAIALLENQLFRVAPAKDGRGEILRLRDGEIVRERLTEKDVKQFQKVSIALNQQEKQVADTAARFLHLMGRKVWNSDQGSKNYNLMTDQSGLLVIGGNRRLVSRSATRLRLG